MSDWDRFRRYPIVAVAISSVALLVTAGGLWALLSSEPIVPAALEWARTLGDLALILLLVISMAAVVGWMAWIQYRILRAVSIPEIEDELPENASVIEGWLSAGSDMTVKVPINQAPTARSVTFRARQGKKLIVRRKSGVVVQSDGIVEIPFKAKETRQLKTGHLLIEITIVTGDGNRLVPGWMAIRTVGPL